MRVRLNAKGLERMAKSYRRRGPTAGIVCHNPRIMPRWDGFISVLKDGSNTRMYVVGEYWEPVPASTPMI